MTDQLSNAAYELLIQALEALDGNTIPPMPAVDREIYNEFEQVVLRLRGKWKRGRGHVFPYDPRAALEAVAVTRTLPAKNPLAYFPTPQALSDELAALMSTPRHVLEPSAGSGNLIASARMLWPSARITAIELDSLNVALLKARSYELPSWYDYDIFGEPGTIEIIEGSFTSFEAATLSEPVDLVLMNPPFTLDGDNQAWFTHMRYAYELLAPGGEILCIAPSGAWENSSRKFWIEAREWLYSIGFTRLKLEAGAFGESGTGVATMVIRAGKPSKLDYSTEHCGYPSFYAWRGWLAIDCSEPMIERGRSIRALSRDAPEVQKFVADGARLACDEGDHCPVTNTTIDQMLEHWDSWRSEFHDSPVSSCELGACDVKPSSKKTSKRSSVKSRKRDA